jgi:hypothetical protein
MKVLDACTTPKQQSAFKVKFTIDVSCDQAEHLTVVQAFSANTRLCLQVTPHILAGTAQ